MPTHDTTSMPEGAGHSKEGTTSDARIRACLALGFSVYRVGDVYGDLAPEEDRGKWFVAAPAERPDLSRLIEEVELGQTQEDAWARLIEAIVAAGGLKTLAGPVA